MCFLTWVKSKLQQISDKLGHQGMRWRNFWRKKDQPKFQNQPLWPWDKAKLHIYELFLCIGVLLLNWVPGSSRKGRPTVGGVPAKATKLDEDMLGDKMPASSTSPASMDMRRPGQLVGFITTLDFTSVSHAWTDNLANKNTYSQNWLSKVDYLLKDFFVSALIPFEIRVRGHCPVFLCGRREE